LATTKTETGKAAVPALVQGQLDNPPEVAAIR
jgi:hypothetical protein